MGLAPIQTGLSNLASVDLFEACFSAITLYHTAHFLPRPLVSVLVVFLKIAIDFAEKARRDIFKKYILALWYFVELC